MFIRPFGLTSDKATSEIHINNLQQIATENSWFLHRSVLTIISDNGPDWKTDSMANIYNFGRFWEENKLDALIWVSYAPGNSRYNPIERMFSHLTDLIANVIIDLDPTFSNINHQLDSALIELNKYWHTKKYDKFKIDCRSVFSVNGNSFDGHQELKDTLLKSSIKHIMNEENDNIRFNLQLYLRHCVRSSYYVSFIKCTDSTCVHCSRHPVRAKKTIELLRSCGNYLPWPQMTLHKYHYDTFLQRTYALLAGENNAVPDQQLPSGPTKHCSACKLPYIFSSKADEERHMMWIHQSNVVQQLYIKNHDIHSIRIILSTFDHPSVFRLREAWRMFRVQKPKFYRALKYLWNVLSQENNWDDYHSWLEQKFIKDCLNKNQPMLLFIGYVLSKMINDHFRYYQISNHNKNKKSSRVNMTLIEYIKSSPKHYK
ncbi:unnamed protein product [Rotaria sp. Silwood2]|nr:unnamed protein product [Rotaria sp. Silwood2]